MSLTKCKECGKEVSDTAKVCPHCGVKDPWFGAKQKTIGCLGAIAIFAAILYFVSGSDSTETQIPKTCDANDAECIATKLMRDIDVVMNCKSPIEKLIKYDFEWTDGFTAPTFSKYLLSEDGTSMMLLGDRLKATNGFNAKVPMIYLCDVDIKSHKIKDVKLEQGRFNS